MMIPEPWEMGHDLGVSFGAEHSSVLFSALQPVENLGVNHSLLQEEASLTGVERCTDLRI